jgi:hypothetical protein
MKHAVEGKTEGNVEVKGEKEEIASSYWNIVRWDTGN